MSGKVIDTGDLTNIYRHAVIDAYATMAEEAAKRIMAACNGQVAEGVRGGILQAFADACVSGVADDLCRADGKFDIAAGAPPARSLECARNYVLDKLADISEELSPADAEGTWIVVGKRDARRLMFFVEE